MRLHLFFVKWGHNFRRGMNKKPWSKYNFSDDLEGKMRSMEWLRWKTGKYRAKKNKIMILVFFNSIQASTLCGVWVAINREKKGNFHTDVDIGIINRQLKIDNDIELFKFKVK